MNNTISDSDPCEALTVKQVAELLGVSQPTVRAYIQRGILPSLELGGCRRILRSDLESFLTERRHFGWRRLRDIRESSLDNSPSSHEEAVSDERADEIPF